MVRIVRRCAPWRRLVREGREVLGEQGGGGMEAPEQRARTPMVAWGALRTVRLLRLFCMDLLGDRDSKRIMPVERVAVSFGSW